MILSSLGHRKGHVRGFTLIELLVVIAIIGILSSVVLASLNTARNKGADAAVKSNLDGIRAQAELNYDTNGNSYGASGTGVALGTCPTSGTSMFFADTSIKNAIAQATSQSGGAVQCIASPTTGTVTSYVVQSPLKATAGTYWCVDSSGNGKAEGAVLSGSPTVCP